MPTIDGLSLFWASAERGQSIPPAHARAMNSRRLMGFATNQRDELALLTRSPRLRGRPERGGIVGAGIVPVQSDGLIGLGATSLLQHEMQANDRLGHQRRLAVRPR